MKKRFLTVELKIPTPSLTVWDVDLETRTLEKVDSYPWLAPQFGKGTDITGLPLPIGQDPLLVVVRELGFSVKDNSNSKIAAQLAARKVGIAHDRRN